MGMPAAFWSPLPNYPPAQLMPAMPAANFAPTFVPLLCPPTGGFMTGAPSILQPTPTSQAPPPVYSSPTAAFTLMCDDSLTDLPDNSPMDYDPTTNLPKNIPWCAHFPVRRFDRNLLGRNLPGGKPCGLCVGFHSRKSTPTTVDKLTCKEWQMLRDVHGAGTNAALQVSALRGFRRFVSWRWLEGVQLIGKMLDVATATTPGFALEVARAAHLRIVVSHEFEGLSQDSLRVSACKFLLGDVVRVLEPECDLDVVDAAVGIEVCEDGSVHVDELRVEGVRSWERMREAVEGYMSENGIEGESGSEDEDGDE